MTDHWFPTTTTEIEIPGANCPWCVNETLDALRRRPGVVAVGTSMSGQCLRVEHRGVDTDQLLDTVREHLHTEAMASAEHVMAAVDAHVAVHVCQRHVAWAPGATPPR
jgi:glucose-6-phosphate dehydrogenase assembly protein OpcA